MNQTFGTSEVSLMAFSFIGFLFAIAPIIFFLWFAITTTSQLKKQTALLEEIKEKLNS